MPVTAQVLPERSGYAESADQSLRVLGKSVNDVPALLPGRRDEGADHGEVASPFLRPEAAGDFLPDLHHAPIALGLIVSAIIKLGNVEVNIEQNKKAGKLLPSWFPL
jgi:hypothetical protein